MKIAFITHDFNRHGGHARYTAELALKFSEDHEVHVFANRWEEESSKRIIFHKVPAIRWSALTTVLSFIIPATIMVKWRNFDIIHSQGLCGLRHSIVTAHFIQLRWLNELKKINKQLTFTQLIWKFGICLIEKYIMKMSKTKKIIAISNSVKEDLLSLFKIEGNKVDVIYHGVDLNKFNPNNKLLYRKKYRRKIGLDDKAKVGLFVGNLQKGAKAAILAVSNVSQVHLVIVSGSNNEFEKKITRDLNLEDRVHWVPLSKEIEKWFAIADFFIFPTLYEPFGMVITEAMASGLPVITSATAGAAELIENGQSGFLLNNAWDPSEITEKILLLVEKHGFSEHIGKNARAAIERYTWELCAKRTMLVFEEVVQEKEN